MIDQTGVPEGYMAAAGGECEDCAFITDIIACVRASCSCDEREDELNVIFIKKTSAFCCKKETI